MATGKRYYWIKLKESFMASDAVDFLMGQPNGSQYVVLYQMLCLKTINTGGRLERHIGEVIIPYDEAKIQRDCKYFTVDTIRVALNLYKALGLVYTDNGGALCLTDYDNLVGSETDWADKRRRQRAEIAAPGGLPGGDIVPTGVPTGVPSNVPADVPQFVPTDIDIDIRDKETRDKRVETREKSTEKRTTGAASGEATCRTSDVRRVIEAWNALGLQTIKKIAPGTDRDQWLRKRIRDYGIDAVLEAIDNVRTSAFLMGDNRSGWQITFDWFIRPNNFPKVLDGNYADREQPKGGGTSPLDDLRALHAQYEDDET